MTMRLLTYSLKKNKKFFQRLFGEWHSTTKCFHVLIKDYFLSISQPRSLGPRTVAARWQEAL